MKCTFCTASDERCSRGLGIRLRSVWANGISMPTAVYQLCCTSNEIHGVPVGGLFIQVSNMIVHPPLCMGGLIHVGDWVLIWIRG